MTIFIRLLTAREKREGLLEACRSVRADAADQRAIYRDAADLSLIPGRPFAYWVSREVLELFQTGHGLQNGDRRAVRTNGTTDDFRWIRACWEAECGSASIGKRWVTHAKGGAFSPFYSDLHLVIAWSQDDLTYPGYQGTEHRPDIRPASSQFFFRPGLTWSRRTQGGLSFRALPRDCIFGDKGPAIFESQDDSRVLLALLAVVNSTAFIHLVSLQVAFGSYEAGVIQQTPIPRITEAVKDVLAGLAQKAWSLKRNLDITEETSHAFVLPGALLTRLGDYNASAIEGELADIGAEINSLVFDLYAFSESDRLAIQASMFSINEEEYSADAVDGFDGEEGTASIDHIDGLLSWAAGVAFGRLDWRLATGERAIPPEPEPFDPLPAKSPGMLPDGASPFHAHVGILVDDAGHQHDLVQAIEEVLVRVEMPVVNDLRRWLQRDFFPFHLQRYSKSRRKAPIYWPLATTSGNYTLWVYYPSLTSQTLYTAINDFVEPKLRQVGEDIAGLRNKGSGRTRDDERQFESLQGLETELLELRDKLQEIAPGYKPHHDDGVQITAAPLWPLFRHKPWQKVLKDTWTKLEKGDYDWAHLAMAYWPDRVREKCKADKSLAIAHGLEDLYVEPAAAPKKTRGRKKAVDAE